MNRNWFLRMPILAIISLVACQKDETSPTGSSSGINLEDVTTDYTVAGILAENGVNHEEPTDYVWDASNETDIVLNGSSISTTAPNVNISGTTATITAAGNYRITGTLNNGQIVVETADGDPVRLILNGVNITNSTSSAIYVASATKTILVLKDGTENFLADGNNYVFANAEEDEPNATLFSKDALTIFGNGKLTVAANYLDGISSKDGLIIASGTIAVTAKDDGIRGKDYLIVQQGSITVDAGGDGLKSDNDEDAALGYVHIVAGDFDLNAGSDAIQGITDLLVEKGNFKLVAGGGSSGTISGTSAKGLKAGSHLVIDDGSFDLSTADDALHSNNNLCINAGSFTIASKDDGIHADTTLAINSGDITITKAYEGIESMVITVNGGNIHLTSSDDGINVAGGNDGSASGHFPGAQSSSSSDFYLIINGGYIVVNAVGDGLDANGSIEMTGGTVLVNGPTAQMNGALDYDGSFNVSGGLLIAAGSAGMLQAPGTSSDQYSVVFRFDVTQSAGILTHLQTEDGQDLINFQPAKNFQALVVSSPALKKGASYSFYTSGTYSGEATDGLYANGSYTPGTKVADFTVSDKVTTVQ